MTAKLQKLTTALCLLALIASPLAVINPSRPAVDPANPGNQAQEAGQSSGKAQGTSRSSKAQPTNSEKSSNDAVTPTTTVPNLSKGAVRQKDRILARNGQVFPIRQYHPMLTPNDPYANQWWVAPNGMETVWGMAAGARATKIAIIDTGYALNHQEFNGRWAINGGESGLAATQGASKRNCTDQGLALDQSCNNIDDNFDGIVDNESGATTRQNPSRLNCTDQGVILNKNCNRLDDDGNGYIDDWRGWDFVSFDGFVQAGETNPDGDGTTHGTMVAGILGATGNNGVGLAGVNWNSSILPIQALNDDSYGDSYTVGESVYYAADQGADVISISLGTAADDPYMRLAIQYALERGSIVVAASGNDGCNCIVYPANYPEVIAVGALDSTNNPASFSSYGANLDVVAPGASLTSSYWTKANQTSSYASNVAGTSFATPFIAGLLGLARSHQANANWDEIVGAMLERSDRRSLTAASPRSNTLGYGASKADNMLARLTSPAQPAIRYQFGGTPAVGSLLSYQCENTLPATLLYELTKPSQLRYTVNKLEQRKLAAQGWTSRALMHTCIGLPSDLPASLRVINLPAEIRNQHLKQ